MTITIGNFLRALGTYPALVFTTILTLGVIFVNGWTDAPNSIATCISTRSMKPRAAIILAAVFNFLGVFVMTMVNTTVAETVYKMVDFGGDTHEATVALCAALFAIVLWATAAWWFGIPTSESHALIAGISGAAIALQGGFKGINPDEWVKVVYGLFLSVILGFGLGFIVTKLIELIFWRMSNQKSASIFGNAQIIGAAGMAFMHGAQDGQKFMSVFMLGAFLSQGKANVTEFSIPVWIIILCSAIMAISTSIGGYRIIKTVGMSMVKLKNTRVPAILQAPSVSLSLLCSDFRQHHAHQDHRNNGSRAAKRLSSINWNVVKDMVSAWLLTFPDAALSAI